MKEGEIEKVDRDIKNASDLLAKLIEAKKEFEKFIEPLSKEEDEWNDTIVIDIEYHLGEVIDNTESFLAFRKRYREMLEMDILKEEVCRPQDFVFEKIFISSKGIKSNYNAQSKTLIGIGEKESFLVKGSKRRGHNIHYVSDFLDILKHTGDFDCLLKEEPTEDGGFSRVKAYLNIRYESKSLILGLRIMDEDSGMFKEIETSQMGPTMPLVRVFNKIRGYVKDIMLVEIKNAQKNEQ